MRRCIIWVLACGLVGLALGCGGDTEGGDDNGTAADLLTEDLLVTQDVGYSDKGALSTCPEKAPWGGGPCSGSLSCYYRNMWVPDLFDVCTCSNDNWLCTPASSPPDTGPDIQELSFEDVQGDGVVMTDDSSQPPVECPAVDCNYDCNTWCGTVSFSCAGGSVYVGFHIHQICSDDSEEIVECGEERPCPSGACEKEVDPIPQNYGWWCWEEVLEWYCKPVGCQIAKDCDDGDSCTVDTCTPGDDGACQHDQLPADECQHCPFGNDWECVPPSDCFVGYCDEDAEPMGLCVFEEVTCDGGNACEECTCDPVTGEMVFLLIDCDDGNLCTIDSCNPIIGCIYQDKGVNCNDDKKCTIDSCDPVTGDCVFTLMDCVDKDPCNLGWCDPFDGICKTIPNECGDPNGCGQWFCDPLDDDGDPCDFYLYECDDGNACTDGFCDPDACACSVHFTKLIIS